MSATSDAGQPGGLVIQTQPSFPVRVLRGTLSFVRSKPLGAFGAFILILIVIVAIFSPWIAQYPVNYVNSGDELLAPNSTYWFGTDYNGRDIFSQIVYGAQVTALVGAGTVILVGVLSISLGLISGYFMGITDFLLQRVIDVWITFPGIFLILGLVAVLGMSGDVGFLGLGRGPDFGPDPRGGPWIWNTFPRTTVVVIVLGVVLGGRAVRVVRSSVLSVTARPYVEAAHVVGATHFRIMMRHVLPNIMATVIVLATIQLGTAVLLEAILSFLGVGITGFPTWGQMLSGRTRDLMASNLHLGLFPGFAIFLAVFGFNMLGDALRDVLDPRLRGSR